MAQFRTLSTLAIAPLFIVPCAFATLSAFTTSGCEGYHNEQERLDYKMATEKQVQLDNHGWPGYNPQDPTQCPNNECLGDPGSREVHDFDCRTAESGYEFMPMPIWDFEDDRTGFVDDDKDRTLDRTASGVALEGEVLLERYALHGYTYRDDTTYNYYPFGWEPPAISDPSALCDRTDNHIFHIAGGPFLEWGGALGRALRCMNSRSGWDANPGQIAINAARTKHYKELNKEDKETEIGAIYCHTGQSSGATFMTSGGVCERTEKDPLYELCPERDRLYKKDKTAPVDPPQDKALIGQALDVTKWEGISFWARRGPNSQPGIRVLVADKYTDDDINFLQYIVDPTAPRYCGRSIECKCKSATRPCTKLSADESHEINKRITSQYGVANPDEINSYDLNPAQPGDTVCWDRKDPDVYGDPFKVVARNIQYCGASTVRHQTDSAKSLNLSFDPFIQGSECQKYTFRGSIVSNFVFNPESEDVTQQAPFENSEQCGDHWMKSIDLSYDWQFYTVPFNELLQQGWAKRQYKLDLTAITMVRLAWDRGYIDYYFDDVRLYRKATEKTETAETK